MKSHSQVIIIGAGAAGIATGCRLLENGFHDFLILEAGSRIGGRIHTTCFADGIVDLGAQWVHGETGNVISSMAQPLGLLGSTVTERAKATFIMSPSSIKLCTSTSKKILDMLAAIVNNNVESLKNCNGSLGEFVEEELKMQMSKEKLSLTEISHIKVIMDWYEKFENSIDGSDSWFNTSGRGHTEYWECPGNVRQAWRNGGYQMLFDLLRRKFPDPKNTLPIDSKIVLNREVTNIVWDSQENNATVRCSDNSFIITDHVIVTVSLGVLKEVSKTLFTPPLPHRKLTAINGLSIGSVNKIFLRFPVKWWPQQERGFSFLWTDDDMQSFNASHTSKIGRHWLIDVFGFYAVDSQPNVLCGWIVGPSARFMETLSDKEVNECCMELLNHFLGDKFNIPQPIELLRSSWSTNPFFRGVYSYRSMDTEAMGTSAALLAEPLTNSRGKQTVLFAGEATHDHFFSTVHGAVESGWREAERVTKLLPARTSSRL